MGGSGVLVYRCTPWAGQVSGRAEKPRAPLRRYTADVTVTAFAALTALPEKRAVQRFFDTANAAVLRWVLVAATPGAMAGFITSLTVGRPLLAGLWGAALAVDLFLIFGRRSQLAVDSARQLLIAFLVSHILAAALSLLADEPEPAYVFVGYVFPASLILFRMRWFEYASLGLGLFATASWIATGEGMPGETGARIGLMVGAAACTVIVTGIAIQWTRRKRRQFLTEWRREVAREREETRMRGELSDAREIQLSMLPRAAPALDWLDSSGLSIPASEVGGDYYEYFELDADRLVLVIGDVAGHGVASGLVLSGVRSGLHLLRDELARPVEVLGRLNRMVRETAPTRMFVTLQVALIERRRASLTLANAGHPPLLLLSGGDDEPRRVGTSGLPLGTRLDPDYQVERHELGRGDTLVLYTDGVLEARNLSGVGFGEDRLSEEARKVPREASARQVRDAIVSGVTRFKGDAVQVDDLTLVVIKLGDLGPGR